MARGPEAFPNASSRSGVDGVCLSPWQNPASGGSGAATPGTSGGGFMDTISNLINQLGTMISQLTGGSSAGSGASAGTPQNVADATFSSTGDPHLSETGTLQGPDGTTTVNKHFDSMSGHSDLLDSQSFAGGYQLSTTVTDPNAKGVTYNQSATVALNNGADSVTLDKDGSYSITSGGTSMSLNPGQSLQLSGGAEVTRNADGSLKIDANNGSGGSISTTLAANGTGVNATAAAHDVVVGGDIAGGISTPTAPSTSSNPLPFNTTSNWLDDVGLNAMPNLPTPIAIPSLLAGGATEA